MRRAQLGRRSRIEDTAGDPLEGLVNLFDIGIVLAVAFLIAGLSLTLDQRAHELQRRASGAQTLSGTRAPSTQAPSATQAPQTSSAGAGTQTLSAPAHTQPGSGHGKPLGTLYRLNDGKLLLVPQRAR
jgi:hypothetical protein